PISKENVRTGDVVFSKEGGRLYTVIENKKGLLGGRMLLESPRGGQIEIKESDYDKFTFHRKNDI
ncbi:MAG: hypothetical protein LBQ84_05850, partial [Flavobacteriaceae bacterium]|nr:hypothetical protein [Flavobacteriaceae bacterium]